MTEHHIKESIGRGRFKPDGITRESLTHFQSSPFKRDLSFLLHSAHQDSRVILDGRQALWKRAQTHLIARGRHLQSQRVVGTNEIVLVAERVKGSLEIGDVLPLSFSEKLAAKRALKPFVFTHGLRMVRSAMTHRDPQAKQPHRKPCIDVNRIVAPRRAIVHEHRVGKPVAAEGFGQRVLNTFSVLVRQSLKTQTKARVIIQDGERMGRAAHGGQRSFEIHLPKTIGHLTLEALPVRLGGLTAGVDQAVAMKHSGNRTTRRHLGLTLIFQKTPDLARSPARVPFSKGEFSPCDSHPSLPKRGSNVISPLLIPTSATRTRK